MAYKVNKLPKKSKSANEVIYSRGHWSFFTQELENGRRNITLNILFYFLAFCSLIISICFYIYDRSLISLIICVIMYNAILSIYLKRKQWSKN